MNSSKLEEWDAPVVETVGWRSMTMVKVTKPPQKRQSCHFVRFVNSFGRFSAISPDNWLQNYKTYISLGTTIINKVEPENGTFAGDVRFAPSIMRFNMVEKHKARMLKEFLNKDFSILAN